MVDIEINSSLLSVEQRSSLIEFLNTKITELSTKIELSTLEKIIISNKFTDDVLQIQKEYGSSEHGHTNRDDGAVAAKVLTGEINGKFCQTIVINDSIIAGLFYPEYGHSSFHVLHHELCHVHDNFYQDKIFSQEAREGKGLSKLEHNLVCHADVIWQEYIAVRLSAASIPVGTCFEELADKLYLSYLFNLIESCRNNLSKAIEDYRSNKDINKLFELFQEETSMLFKIAATVQGYFDGLCLSDNNEILDCVNENIKQTYFYDVWINQWEALKLLYDSYPNWNDVYQLKDLGKVIQLCWNKLGIYPRDLSGKDYFYIDVP